MLLERTLSLIRFEIKSIDRLLFESYVLLLELPQRKEPNLIEMTALASVLHSFYNGVENIFQYIAQEFLKVKPVSERWHRELLDKMTEKTRGRKPVITVEIASQLEGYLGFRHFFRHSYCDLLEWNKLEGLVLLVADVWNQLKAEVNTFLTSELNKGNE